MTKVKVGRRRPVVMTRTLGGQRIDVLGVLGEGAFAVIFSCKISEGQRDVAVKIERQVRTGLYWLLLTPRWFPKISACLEFLRYNFAKVVGH